MGEVVKMKEEINRLESTNVDEMKGQLGDVLKERDALTVEVDQQKSLVQSLEEKLSRTTKDLQDIKSYRDETEEESNLKQTQLEFQLHKVTKELDEANGTNKSLLSSKTSLEESLSSLRVEFEESKTSLQNNLVSVEKEVIEYQMKTKIMEEKLANKDKELEAKQQILDYSAKCESDMKEKLSAASLNDGNKDQEIVKLKEQLDSLRQKFESEVQKCQESEERVAKLRDERSELLMKMEKGDGVAALNQQITQENERVIAQRIELQKKLDQLQSDRDSTVGELSSQLQETKAQIARSNEQVTQQAALLEKINLDCSELKSKLAKTEADYKMKSDEIISLEASNAKGLVEHQNEIATLKSTIDSKDHQLDQRNIELEGSRKTMEDLQTRLGASQEEHISQQAALQEKLQGVQSDLRLSSHKVEELTNQVQASKEDNLKHIESSKLNEEKFSQRISDLNSTLESVKNELTSKQTMLLSEEASHKNTLTMLTQIQADFNEEQMKAVEMKSKLEAETSAANQLKIQVQEISLEVETRNSSLIEKDLKVKELELELKKSIADLAREKEAAANLTTETDLHKATVLQKSSKIVELEADMKTLESELEQEKQARKKIVKDHGIKESPFNYQDVGCGRCGGRHKNSSSCPAMQSDRYCYKCGRPGHYAKVCRTKPSSITKKPAGKLSPAQNPAT